MIYADMLQLPFIVMRGDPYCPHCGAHFRWTHGDEQESGLRDLRITI